MAHAVLCSLAQTVDLFLNHDQYPISRNGKRRLESLREKATFLQEFIEKYPEHAESLETRTWIAANEAEDIIEHFMYEHIRSRHKSAASNYLYGFRELDMAMEEIDSVSQEATDIATENVPLARTPVVRRTVPSWSSTLARAPVGLEEDLKNIKDSLRGASDKREIIPITGMGGIGKTTLARTAYDAKVIVEGFPVRAWVTVSQDYKTENIFANLLESLQKIVGNGTGRSSDSAEDKVYKILCLRKYLIVLDDLWSEKAWDDIRQVFPDRSNGSRIIITTRLKNVAAHVDPSSPLHEMRFLDKDQSWDLLNQSVFPNKRCPSNLESIGKDIATNCGGLPLAIVLIAGILSTSHEARDSWEEVGKNVRSAVDKESGEFEERISLSYSYLPHHLRACFLHMGGFPQDYEIRVSKLIKLWIAEGFVKPRNNKSLEEGAAEYLEDLLMRNLVMIANRKSNGRIKSCTIHDLVRELCKSTSLDENYERRLSIAHPDLTRLVRAYGPTLRSVITFKPDESHLHCLKKFRLLRLLDVVDTDVYSLTSLVFELFHLRYLSFGCPIQIPAAISQLQNLRTLIIRPSKRFRQYSNDELYLPLEIWALPLLTDLISFFDILPNPEAAPSSSLQTLSVVKKLICTQEMMEIIPNLKKLGITYFGDKYEQDYELHNLVHLHRLEKLKLVMKSDSVLRLAIKPDFPETLRKLTLSGWRLPWEYLANVGSFPNLQVLKLRDHAFEGGTWRTTEEQFPNLEFLHIDASDLDSWETESRHFPKLKRIVLYRCSSLSEIPDDIGEIATLERIEVDHANEDLVECVKRIQEEQEEYGNTALQVLCVHYQGS